jgi:hypothetical protein
MAGFGYLDHDHLAWLLRKYIYIPLAQVKLLPLEGVPKAAPRIDPADSKDAQNQR